MNKFSKLAGAAAAATLVAISGSAFTGGVTNMPAAATVGYGATTVSGATLNTLTYEFSADRTTITGVTFQLATDTTGQKVELLANDVVKATCTGTLATGNTNYTCGTLTIDAQTLVETAISVTGGLNKV